MKFNKIKKFSKIFKLAIASTVALTLLTALTACGSSSDSGSDNSNNSASSNSDKDLSELKIGIIQYMEHDALDFAREGFIQELVDYGFDEKSIEVQNAQGESANNVTIANKFVNDQVDLILAISTQSAQAAVQATSTIPIVGTAITNYEIAGLTTDNITGTSNMNPPQTQFDLIKTILPDVSTVGFLYCSNEANAVYQVENIIALLEDAGINTKTYTVADSNEVPQVAQKAISEVELLYVPNDNVIAQTIASVGLIAGEAGIPVVCGESSVAANGGLVAYALDYKKLGAQSGRQAIRILVDGEDISKMPVEYMPEDEIDVYLNVDKIGRAHV